MNENQIQANKDKNVSNNSKINSNIDNDDYYYYYYDEEEDSNQDIDKKKQQLQTEQVALIQNSSVKQTSEPQLDLTSKKEALSTPVILDGIETASIKAISNLEIVNENNQLSKSLSLPDYKPKDIGKGFSSSSSDGDEYDVNSANKLDKAAKSAQQPMASTVESNDDDNYYSDDFPEESSQRDRKTKSPQKVKFNSKSNKSDLKIAQIEDNDNDSQNQKEASPTNKKGRSGRRKSSKLRRCHKQYRRRRRKSQGNNSFDNSSVGSVDSANSFDSNNSFNDYERDEKSGSPCNSSLTYSIGDENEIEEEENFENLKPQIKKIINNYKTKISQITQNNEKLQQNNEELKESNIKFQQSYNDLLQNYKKLQQSSIKFQQSYDDLLQNYKKLQQSNDDLQQKNKKWQQNNKELQQKIRQLESEKLDIKDEINDLKDENKLLQKKLNQSSEKNTGNAVDTTPSFAVIDRFKDVKTKKICLLGRGSSSKVIEVEDIKTGKHYAKKILFKEFLDFKGIKHFIAEFELLQYLSHPCTATVYGFEMGVDEEHPCSIYFEVLQVSLLSAINASDSLAQTLSTSSSTSSDSIASPKIADSNLSSLRFLSAGHRLFTNSLRARCLVEICCGMQYVHDCGIIHRDLKAENILFNETLNAKICDFGIAQLQCADNLTKNVGSLFYMSPEMLAEKEYDKSTDVYSFGILAYFVLTGELPKIPLTKKALGCLPEVPPYVTKLGKEIILSCCCFNPKDRPSFSDLLSLMEKNNFQLISNINNSFVRQRYEELMQFKQSHPAQLISK